MTHRISIVQSPLHQAEYPRTRHRGHGPTHHYTTTTTTTAPSRIPGPYTEGTSLHTVTLSSPRLQQGRPNREYISQGISYRKGEAEGKRKSNGVILPEDLKHSCMDPGALGVPISIPVYQTPSATIRESHLPCVEGHCPPGVAYSSQGFPYAIRPFSTNLFHNHPSLL
jgi:hypothetical protein